MTPYRKRAITEYIDSLYHEIEWHCDEIKKRIEEIKKQREALEKINSEET